MWEEACLACEIPVVITAPLKATITPLLFYDKREKGFGGRALKAPVPEVFLETGDRLEPSDTLPDVSLFEQVAPGTTVTF